MAKTLDEIQQIVLDAKQQASGLNALQTLTTAEIAANGATSTSYTAKWRVWVWVFSFAHYVMQQIWEVFREEVNAEIEASRSHNKQWYREKALNYLFGVPLITDTDNFDTTGLTDAQIATAKIVANCAHLRVVINNVVYLRLKLVGISGDDYTALTAAQVTAINAYFNEHCADAGTYIMATSGNADKLKIETDIYFDPLIIGADGKRLDGTDDEPILNGIKNYLKSIDFNGRYITTKLTDSLQSVEGIILPVVKNSWSKYGAYQYTDTAVNVGIINEMRVADAGYMELDETETIINYIAYTD